MAIKTDKYEKVYKASSTYFTSESLTKLVDSKIDIHQLRTYMKSQATKQDLDLHLQMLKDQARRLEQLSLMQVETARSLLPEQLSLSLSKTTQETRQSKITRRNQLLNNANIIYRQCETLCQNHCRLPRHSDDSPPPRLETQGPGIQAKFGLITNAKLLQRRPEKETPYKDSECLPRVKLGVVSRNHRVVESMHSA